MSGIQVVLEPGVEGWELLEQGQLATGMSARLGFRAISTWQLLWTSSGLTRRSH
jgi:hypothetical protein